MAQDGDARDRADLRPDESLRSEAAADSLDAPPGESGDSLLRAAAQIDEPSAAKLSAYVPGAPAAQLQAGAVIAKRYRLERELGRGGMGVVWEATHLVTRRRAAIKFVVGPAHRRGDLSRRFLREARAASAVRHPNVVEVLDVFELEDATPVMVMELLQGETLRDRLVREGKLSLEVTASILVPVVAAVAAAHSSGIIHRDLKPENIFLLHGSSRSHEVKVLDFGVAKLTSSDGEAPDTDSLTDTGAVLGTPYYMAPEQTRGDDDVDARADIWALGVIVYECLAGARPVEGSGVGQLVMRLMTKGIRPLDQAVPGLPAEAAALVMRMLAIKRDDRPRDLREVEDTFARLMPGGPARVPSTPGRIRRAPHRSRIVGAAAGAMLLASLVAWRVGSPPRPSPAAPERAEENATRLSPVALAASPPGETAASVASAGAPSARPSASSQPAPPPPASAPRPKVVSPSAVAVPSPLVAPATATAPATKADCDPPYEFDGHGKKTWKRECL